MEKRATRTELRQPEKSQEKAKYYTTSGTEDKESDKTVAKLVDGKNLVRVTDRGDLYNPWGLYADSTKLNRWIPINSEAFDIYTKYLETRNQLFFRQAQRLI
jgi:hypothetical protein